MMEGKRLSRAAFLLRDYIELLQATCSDGNGGNFAQDLIDDARELADLFSEAATRKMVISE